MEIHPVFKKLKKLKNGNNEKIKENSNLRMSVNCTLGASSKNNLTKLSTRFDVDNKKNPVKVLVPSAGN